MKLCQSYVNPALHANPTLFVLEISSTLGVQDHTHGFLLLHTARGVAHGSVMTEHEPEVSRGRVSLLSGPKQTRKLLFMCTIQNQNGCKNDFQKHHYPPPPNPMPPPSWGGWWGIVIFPEIILTTILILNSLRELRTKVYMFVGP